MRRLDGGTFTFEPHSRTHPHLTEIDPARARQEITGSARRLEDELGRRNGPKPTPSTDRLPNGERER